MKPSSSPQAKSPEQFSAELLQKAVRGLNSGSGLQKAIKSKILGRIETGEVLVDVRSALTPHPSIRASLWNRIKLSISETATSTLWEQIRQSLPLGDRSLLWKRMSSRLQPIQHPSWSMTPALRYAATFVLLAFIVRMSPMLFTPATIAKTEVELRPTRGEVSILIGGLFQRIDRTLPLEKSALIQTGENGGATIVLHDAAVLRLGPSTTVALHDVSDRPSKAYSPTMTLYRGKLWVQAFLGNYATPLSIGTEQGTVQINEGSVALLQGGAEEAAGTDVRVWNRSVTVVRTIESISLFAGDRVRLASEDPAHVTKMPRAGDDDWSRMNLSLDLVHQREIARLQQQRFASQAGVLPNSAFYPIKRLAEQVDVLLTIGSEAKTEKLLAQAETRLSEAAALLKEGSHEDAQVPLQEYRDVIQSVVASGSGGKLALVSERVAHASEALSAALPNDEIYSVRETVLQTANALPPFAVSELEDSQVMERELLSDRMVALMHRVAEGTEDVAVLRAEERSLVAAVQLLRAASGGIPHQFFGEADSILPRVDSELTAMEVRLRVASTGSSLQTIPNLTDSQVDSYVDRILRRILVYTQLRSQTNQLLLELRALRGNPEAGRILRRLHKVVPDASQRHFIDLEINFLSSQIRSGELHQSAPEELETLE